jgi:uncharacterized protein GlcG (DUF336 family)
MNQADLLVRNAHGSHICRSMAVRKGWKENIAIIDSGADLVALEPMNGCAHDNGPISLLKAEKP